MILGRVSSVANEGEGEALYPWIIQTNANVQRLNFVAASTGPVFAGTDFDLLAEPQLVMDLVDWSQWDESVHLRHQRFVSSLWGGQ